MTKLIIYTDGGSRGNPGPSAIGVAIRMANGGEQSRTIGNKSYGEQIKQTTNNIAEYSAVVFALKKAKQLLGKAKAKLTEIDLRADSELLIKQLNGLYKIENEGLQPLFIKIWNLKQDFKKVVFTHVPREKNREADRLVNKALDTLL